MQLKNHIIDKIIKFLANKLAENRSFQKFSLKTYRRIENIQQTTFDEFLQSDFPQTKIHLLLRKLVKSGQDFLKNP